MAMKETVRSLRAFFILSGIASLCFGFLGLAVNLQTAISPATLLVASIGIVGVFLSFPVCGRFSSRTAAEFIAPNRHTTLRQHSVGSLDFLA